MFLCEKNCQKKPYKKECGIVNLDNSSGPGTHWVAYYKDDDIKEYFDSFGNLQPPKEIIKYLGKNNLSYNYNQIQDYNTFNCGHLCIEFLINVTRKNK